ncbi:cell death protein 3-like [Mercenaria mercenaria]|uniref:cell death protein 3-like n=1 Tax=Mercenaria mercenaria TaxID=6596 RepID=UPI00234F9E33|nr:cell death protein 3-like [Mercenaria mercenaria]
MERTEDMEIRIEQLEEAKLIYKMTEGGRKMCLIIANSKFSRQARLEACKLDCRYLTALFTGLNFDVEGKENLTAEGIKAFLEDKKRHLDVDLECFACVITSHGDPRGILGIDDAVIEFQNILDMFDRDHCPELANKPKLFLFDVCRRSGVDLVQLKAKKIVNYTMIPPTKSDILVAHATTNDYVSFCDRNYGSRFCRSFVKVVSENACRYSILDMLLMVNEMVGEFTSGGVLQSVQFDCSMRKQFFFPLPVIRQAKAIAAHETKTSLEEDRDVKQTGL